MHNIHLILHHMNSSDTCNHLSDKNVKLENYIIPGGLATLLHLSSWSEVVSIVTLPSEEYTRRSSRILKFTRIRMDSIEGNIRLLLQGKEIEESQDFCDFTLQDQNEVTGRAGGRKQGTGGRNAKQVEVEKEEEKRRKEVQLFSLSPLSPLTPHLDVRPLTTPCFAPTFPRTSSVSQSVNGIGS